MTLSALYVARNEEDIVKGSIDLVLPYVDELIFVDMQSTDNTRKIVEEIGNPKIKIYDYPYSEPLDMGKARTFSLEQATGDWFMQVDCDEYYPAESMQKIREFIENPGQAISLRIAYHNVAWRVGYVQADFGHYPDRLYKREVVQGWEGVLPLDMTVVKPEFRQVKEKSKGMQGVLEYDNEEDRSFESADYPYQNPFQPIRKDIIFYHLARARGFNYEFNKRLKYEKFIHPTKPDWENERNARWNQWVTGMYPIEKHDFPPEIPQRIIPNPKVSVVVSCYNKAPYIAETLESILANNPYEVIVVNDGSTDNSETVIRQYDVKLINQTNQGVATARNVGLNTATGDYFILIDGDDKLAPNYIERCLAEMQGDIQVVFTDFQGIGEWDWRHHYSGNMDDLKTNQCVPSVMALCDMRILDPYGNFKPDAIREDFEFWLNVYFNRKMNFKHIPEPLCYYRRTTGSRIDHLDSPEQKENGYQQIRDWYGKFGVDPKY